MASTTMYAAPRFIDSNPKIALPTCMYEMKKIQDAKSTTEQESNEDQSYPPEITRLFQRQIKNLKDLENIRKQLDSLEKKAGVKHKDIHHRVERREEKDQVVIPQDEDVDIVITAKPSNPPFSAFILFNYLKQQGMQLFSACHKHSNLKGTVPFDLMKSIGWKDSVVQSHDKLNFTFIWKEDQFGPSVIVNPRVQTAIKGDANIARFLCRKFAPQLYECLSENGTLIADYLLDLATSQIVNGDAEAKKNALVQFEKQLANKRWLVDDKLSIADIVVFSAIRITKSTGLIPQNMQKWFRSIKEKFC